MMKSRIIFAFFESCTLFPPSDLVDTRKAYSRGIELLIQKKMVKKQALRNAEFFIFQELLQRPGWCLV